MSIYAYLVIKKNGRSEDISLLEAQEKLIAKYAAENSMLISEWFRERNITLRGPVETRPVANELKKKLKSGDAILFATFNAFASTPQDALLAAEALLEKKVQLHFCHLGGQIFKEHKELLLTIFQSFVASGAERSSIRARSSRNNAVVDGEYKGGVPPYGYRFDKEQDKLVEEEWRRDVIKMIAQAVVDGIAIRPTCKRIEKELKVPISVFTVQKLKDSDEVKKVIATIGTINKVL